MKTSEQMIKRKQYLDIAKGIGIILVVLGHCPLVYNPLKQWIYTFHMPLFFLMSGMGWERTLHAKRGFFNKAFFLGKLKRLIVPCYVWGLVYMIFYAIINKKFSYSFLAYLVYGNQNGFSHANSLTSLWFLPCMFLTVCAFEIIQKIMGRFEKRLLLFAISILFAALGLLLPHVSWGYPWSIDVAFLGFAFMTWGYLSKGIIEKERSMLLLVCVMLGTIVTLTFTYRLNLQYVNINNVDMAGRHFGNVLLYLIDALAGILATISLAKLIEAFHILAKGLTYLGKRTISIFILHKPILQLFNKIGINLKMNSFFIVATSLVVSITLSLLIYYLIMRILPFVFGEK